MKKQHNFAWQSGVDFRSLDGFADYEDHVLGCASDIDHAAEIHQLSANARKRDGFDGLIKIARELRAISPVDFRRWNCERSAIKNFVQVLNATDNLSGELLATVTSHNLGICAGLDKPYDEKRFWARTSRSIMKNLNQDEISDWAFRRRFVDLSSCSGINSVENDRKLLIKFLDCALDVVALHMRHKINSHKLFRDIEYKWRYGSGRNTIVALATAELPNKGWTNGL